MAERQWRRAASSASAAASTPSAAPPSTVPFYERLLSRGRRGRRGGDGGGPPGEPPPALLLAPMENLADRPCRLALLHAAGGGFDEACTEFIRVPAAATHPASAVRGLVRGYDAAELGGVPLAAQLMGSNAELLAMATEQLVHAKRAPRVDLNCGCPANTVTGRGAGSSLLRDPELLRTIVAAMVRAAAGAAPVTVKLRSGHGAAYDAGAFMAALAACEDAGAAFVTVHPRTRVQGYAGRADYGVVAAAVAALTIPVVGNGDVTSVAAARALLRETGCSGVMVGRGALQDPLLFRRLRRALGGGGEGSRDGGGGGGEVAEEEEEEWRTVVAFARDYALRGPDGAPLELAPDGSGRSASGGGGGGAVSAAGRAGRVKKLAKYLLLGLGDARARAACRALLRAPNAAPGSADALLEELCELVRRFWVQGGPPGGGVAINHMTLGGGVPEACGES